MLCLTFLHVENGHIKRWPSVGSLTNICYFLLFYVAKNGRTKDGPDMFPWPKNVIPLSFVSENGPFFSIRGVKVLWFCFIQFMLSISYQHCQGPHFYVAITFFHFSGFLLHVVYSIIALPWVIYQLIFLCVY